MTRTASTSGVDTSGGSPFTVMVISAMPSFSFTHLAVFVASMPFCAVLTVVLSAAIAVTGMTLRSISTASTMLKMRFFIFFFPPVILFFSKNFTRFNHLRLAVYHYTKTFPKSRPLNIRRSGVKFRSFQVFR